MSRIDLAGAHNVRDLGGISLAGGREVRPGALVRAGCIDRLTPGDWDRLQALGVATVIDLRNDDERAPGPRPPEVTTVRAPLDGDDDAFWAAWGSGPQFGTPLYYRPHLEAFPRLSAAVLWEIARAAPGGVLVHCSAGRDRTGQVCMLILRLLGADDDAITADYLAGEPEMPALFASLGRPDEEPVIREYLAARGLTREGVFREALRGLDVPALLAAGGLDEADVARLRTRLTRAAA